MGDINTTSANNTLKIFSFMRKLLFFYDRYCQSLLPFFFDNQIRKTLLHQTNFIIRIQKIGLKRKLNPLPEAAFFGLQI